MATNKKSPLSPAAAKILEQYRNAGKTGSPASTDSNPSTEGSSSAPRATAPPPPGASMRRSGTRGK